MYRGHLSGYQQLPDDRNDIELRPRESVDISTNPLSPFSEVDNTFPLVDRDDRHSYTSKKGSQIIETRSVPHAANVSSGRKSRFSGWRVGMTACAATALFSLLLNVCITIAVAAKVGMPGGIGTLYHGSCRRVESMNLWAHLGINALSTILLSGSNYCMQCLSAPTRKDIDTAHAKGKWLDIGIPSIRNLKSISKKRVIMWWVLGLSSVPLHLMYNSAIFSTLGTNYYQILTVAIDYAPTPLWSDASILRAFKAGSGLYRDPTFGEAAPIWAVQEASENYEKLSARDCISAYSTEFLSTRRNLVLVTTSSSTVNGSLLQYDEWVGGGDPFGWICNGTYREAEHTDNTMCMDVISNVLVHADDWRPFGDAGFRVQHCLSEKVEETCSLQFSEIIIIVVIICNLAKFVVMSLTAFKFVWHPIITIGDGIASFLANPDERTKGMCLLTARKANLIESRVNSADPFPADFSPIALPWKPENLRWFRAASYRRWFFCNALCIANLIISMSLLGYGIGQLRSNYSVHENLSSLWKLGFGAVNQQTLISWRIPSDGTRALIANTMIANLPQSILSFLYLTLNGLCTCMFLAQEWSSYAENRKPLRVSSPSKGQRSTYTLQLPYKYAIPLLVVSGALHWFVSQSIFLANINVYDPDGHRNPKLSFSTCGYSPISMIFVIIFGGLLLLFVLALGARQFKTSMPLVGSCSAAISAACHPPLEELKLHAEQRPLQWGVVSGMGDMNGNAHCSFSMNPVTAPQDDGTYYAGMRERRR